MTPDASTEAELEIVYCDFDEYDVERTTVEAEIVVEGDEWIVGLGDETLRFRVEEVRDEVAVVPYRDDYGKFVVTRTADYEPGTGRLEPQGVEHDDMYVDAIVGDAIDETLGELVREARVAYQRERGIVSADVADVDVPDVEFEIRVDDVPHPSSRRSGLAPKEVLVVELVEDGAEHWVSALIEEGNRWQVWGGTQSKGTAALLAPPGYDAGDELTLAELLDAWYTVNPEAVASTASELAAEADRDEQAEALREEHPELRGKEIENPDAFDDAAERGEPVAITRFVTGCSDPDLECSTDRVVLSATPDGEIERDRVHTY